MENKVEEALKFLQDFCNDYECYQCPLRNANNECGVIFDNDGQARNCLSWTFQDKENPRIILS